MKIVMFTPAIKTSAIGGMTSHVTHELVNQGHEVLVVRTETDTHLNTLTHDFRTEIVNWNETNKVAKHVDHADVLVYQIGNDYEFHSGALEWLQQFPGIVCLHDFFLGHLFYGWGHIHRTQALAILRSWYGEVAQYFFHYNSPTEFIDNTKDISPMTEWICSMATGVITHSSWGAKRVLSSCGGPVYVIPLAPGRVINVTKEPDKFSKEKTQFNLLTIGHMNPNKRIDTVIRAVGNSPILSRHTTYNLVGPIPDFTAAEFSSLANSLGVTLTMSGKVEDDVLIDAIETSDVICCLRWPTLEAASASAIEAMLHGKPIIVINTGFYSDLPDNCVIKIPIENELFDLQLALEELFKDKERRLALGNKAREWALKTFQADHYAKRIIDMAHALSKATPMMKVIQNIARMMNQWGAAEDLIHLPEIVEPLRALAGPN